VELKLKVKKIAWSNGRLFVTVTHDFAITDGIIVFVCKNNIMAVNKRLRHLALKAFLEGNVQCFFYSNVTVGKGAVCHRYNRCDKKSDPKCIAFNGPKRKNLI